MVGRGERADDSLRAIRASWGERTPVYQGTHFSFADVVIDPTGVQERLPIWVGGRTKRSLRRAVEFGDAWTPFFVMPEEARDWLAEAKESAGWESRDSPLDIVLWPEPAADPLTEPETIAEQVERHVECGVTILNWRFPSRSLAHHLEQMEALTTLVDPTWS